MTKIRSLADLERSRPSVDPARRTLAVSLETMIVSVIVSILALGWITFEAGRMVGRAQFVTTEAQTTARAEYYRNLLVERLTTLELAAHLVADEDRATHSKLVERVPGWPELLAEDEGS